MSLFSKVINKEIDLEANKSGPQGQNLFKKLESKINLREQFLKIDPSIEINKVQDSEKISYFVFWIWISSQEGFISFNSFQFYIWCQTLN